MSVSLRRIGNTSSRSGSSGLSVVAARPVKRSVECESEIIWSRSKRLVRIPRERGRAARERGWPQSQGLQGGSPLFGTRVLSAQPFSGWF